ncbi:hypothetical protein SD427_02375 [Chryseobacterium sp. JJR-5R]|uniref:hypothetical protein n=1 Tax=Chryseobacterium sp. JJR-5R TaxID=3093923 RepID=UPI002A75822D|nr:hypothetical protein [Chryseobacterium sp. JJR-5R]WPO83211.1 hypothetical protein SD427_02375 [Chryseobacterium sp. JJR-5R]
MRKLILFSVFINCFVSGQKSCCQYLTASKTSYLKSTGKFELNIKNTGNEFFKVPKEINFCNMRMVDFELFNEETQLFEKMNRTENDIDCFTYSDKLKKIKPDKTYTYQVNLKSYFDIIWNEHFFEDFNDRKYRFKISFAFHDYYNRGENLLTDWIYRD